MICNSGRSTMFAHTHPTRQPPNWLNVNTLEVIWKPTSTKLILIDALVVHSWHHSKFSPFWHFHGILRIQWNLLRFIEISWDSLRFPEISLEISWHPLWSLESPWDPLRSLEIPQNLLRFPLDPMLTMFAMLTKLTKLTMWIKLTTLIILMLSTLLVLPCGAIETVDKN